MLRIALIDDEQRARKTIRQYLEKISEERQESYIMTDYPNGETFLERFDGGYDLIFLDIRMNRLDGMETARRIRTIDKDVVIVFLTNMAQYALEGYAVEVMDYILKPVTYTTFLQKFDRILHRMNRKNERKFIAVMSKKGFRKFPVDQILYVEVMNHDLTYHLKDEDIETSDSMKHAEEMLSGHHFIRCNKCYLVNLAEVERMEDKELVVGNARLLVSRAKKKEVLDALNDYLNGLE